MSLHIESTENALAELKKQRIKTLTAAISVSFLGGVARIVERTPVPVVPMALKGLWGSFFSRRGGAAMTRPFRRGIFSKIGFEVAPAMGPSEATPERLRERILAMRGDWR